MLAVSAGLMTAADSISVTPGGPVVIRAAKAQFELSAGGYWTASLNGLTIDRPAPGMSSDQVVIDGQPITLTNDFDRLEGARHRSGAR